MTSLAGQTAVITGGTRGIGLAVARGLGSAGAAVVLVGTDEHRARQRASELSKEGISATGFGCDVSDAAAVDQLAHAVSQPIDVLVCSAAIMSQRASKTLATSAQHWREVMAINLDGVFHAVQAFAPGMAARRQGRIITLSACLGRFTGPGTSGGLAPYRVSKAAVNALTKNLAAELGNGRRGVLVDAVCPGHCATDMGGEDAPRTAEQGADTVVWLATRSQMVDGQPVATGLLWEDRRIVAW